MRPTGFLLCSIALALFVGCSDDDDAPPPRAATPTASPSPTPTVLIPTSAEVLAVGPYAVGVTTIVFFDESRPTMPSRGEPGKPSRRLATEIWYPAAGAPAPTPMRNAPLDASGGPYPFVLYSHGFSDVRVGGAYIARHLASHGYIVAAPEYPLTSINTPGGPNGADVVNQPGDVSFLIDSLLAAGAENRFAGAIDADRIGLAGLSLGGLTTTLATFHAELRDPRVRAAATLAGPGCNFSEKFYDRAAVPLLLIHGDIDAIVPYAEHGLYGFGIANAPKYLVTIKNGSHTGFTEFASIILDPLDNPDEPGCTAVGGASTADSEGDGGGAGLGGEEVGIIDGNCPDSCRPPFPRAIRSPRQRSLATIATFAFFEAYLRGRDEMRLFLEERATAENEDISLMFE